MFSHEDAQKILKEEQTTDWLTLCLAAIKNELPAAHQPIAYALLNLDQDGKDFPSHSTDYDARQRHWKEIERRTQELAGLLSQERSTIFAQLLPRLATTLEATWQLFERLPYQTGSYRRAFRVSADEQVHRTRRLDWLRNILPLLTCYRQKDLAWLAGWVTYLAPYNTQPFGLLFAAAIDNGGAEGEAIFEILVASAHGEHEIGKMGRHVTTGLLVASRQDGWECIERLLLAAQREEGLRQVVLETVDEAHPEAFRRMLRLIFEHDLLRFSATVRAADVWFGFGRAVEDVSDLRTALRLVLPLLDDQTLCREVIVNGNPQEVFLALWATAFTDAREAITVALPVLKDAMPERRLAAVHLLSLLNLPAAHVTLLSSLTDPDLRVALHAFSGIVYADFAEKNYDLFELVQHLLERMGGKSQAIKSGIWPWLEIQVSPETLLHTMLQYLGERDPRSLIVYLSLMGDGDRLALAKKLAALPVWDEEVRGVLYRLIGERTQWVSSQARDLIAARPLTEADTLALEHFLTRKSVELRRGLITLLLKRDDEAVMSSVGRLLAQNHPLQRLAGLDLLNELVSAKRQVQHAAALALTYQRGREILTPEETALLETIQTASQSVKTPASENVLGLIEPEQRTPIIQPRKLLVMVDTPAACNCLRSLDALIEEQRTTPVLLKTWRGSQEMILGNADVYYYLPNPNPDLSVEEDECANLPLMETWLKWERERPASLRDDDGLELLRATLLLKRTRAAMTILVTGENDNFGASYEEDSEDDEDEDARQHVLVNGSDTNNAVSAPVQKKLHLRYRQHIDKFLAWLIRRQGMSADALHFLFDATEAAFASIDRADLERLLMKKQQPDVNYPDPRNWLAQDGSVLLLQLYHHWHHTHWTPEHHSRYWQLLHWFDEPVPGLERINPDLDVLMNAYNVGTANEADLFDQLGGPGLLRYGRRTELYKLSAQTPPPLLTEYPILSRIVADLRERILEIELRRGEMPTAATPLAFALSYSGGISVFVRLVALLAPTNLARGYCYDNQGKGATWSHLLRVSSPAPEETLEEFARQVREAHLTIERLLAAALYAPQWAPYIEYVLGWPHFVDSVWWIYAHTRGSNWSVDEDIRKIWQTRVAERTIVSAEELLAGAVDVAWFWNSYRELGPERWEQVYAAAKYASDGTGHGRARLYADAMSGKVNAPTMRQRMFEKRQQDVIRALGLVPLPIDDQERKAEIAERYQAFQELKRTGRQFGAQRRASEETAIRIGMENLARTAGFSDPQRLQWAMEAQTMPELRNGALTVIVDGIFVALSLDNTSAEPNLTIVGARGNVLKSLPTRVKKHQEVVFLIERKREIEQQIARMRIALEAAMCRGERFTTREILELLAHPVLSRLLHNLIFIHNENEQPEKKAIGYPLRSESEAGPQLFLQDYNAQKTRIDLAAMDLRLAHPHDLFIGQQWHAWQHECFITPRIQPFKQVFRELYVCTKNEIHTGDEALSQRYHGHQVQPGQAHALLGQRGWIVDYEEGVRRTFHTEKLTAIVSFVHGIFTPTEVEGLTVGSVFFMRRDDYKPVPLASVPPRVFSETMRDLDLMVSVAHSGGVDPEATFSTIEMRAALIQETCTLLGITNVTIKSAHVLIEGTHGHYTIHLGSAIVHRQPGGALCIIPVHAQHQGRIFLPFADNDPRTAEVITKVITLARDSTIKDPSILEQIL